MRKSCDNEELKKRLNAAQAAHDAQLARIIKQDTDIINGLLRKIDALYLLLEKQSDHCDDESADSGQYIHNSQNMKL